MEFYIISPNKTQSERIANNLSIKQYTNVTDKTVYEANSQLVIYDRLYCNVNNLQKAIANCKGGVYYYKLGGIKQYE
jgi:hypothetical protein